MVVCRLGCGKTLDSDRGEVYHRKRYCALRYNLYVPELVAEDNTIQEGEDVSEDEGYVLDGAGEEDERNSSSDDDDNDEVS